MKKQIVKKINNENKTDLKVLKYLFLLLLVLAPLNNGILLEAQFWLQAVLITPLFFYVMIMQGKEIKFGVPEFLLLLLCGSYFLSFLVAVSPNQAYVGFLKYIFYFIVCFLTIRLGNEGSHNKKIVLLTMVNAITVTTILSFLAQAHLIEGTELVIMDRFCSTFLYPNTYAAVLAAILPLTVYLYLDSTKQWVKALLLSVWFLNTVAFYATVSRGALLVYLPALFVLLFLLGKKYRWLVFGNLLLINALGLVVTNLILQNPGVKTLLILLLGLVPVLFLNLLVEKKILRVPFFTGLILVLLFVGGGLIIVDSMEKVSFTKLTRLMEINLETWGVASRLYFYEDACKIIRNHWLIGAGAGGWAVLYTTIQGHLYNSEEVHNSVLQIMVESGIIGVILFLAIFGFLFIQQIWRIKEQKHTALEKIIFLSVLVIFFHSLIDFDLSYVAVSMYLFVLAGLLRGEGSHNFYFNKSLCFVSLVLAGVLFLSSVSMGLAHLSSRQVLADLKAREFGKVIELIPQYERRLSISQKLAPLNPLYSSSLGLFTIRKGLQQKTPTEIENGLQLLERSIALSPFQYESYLTKGLTLAQLQRKKEAIPYFEKIITLMPMQHTGYQYCIENYVLLACETGDKVYLDLARNVYTRTVEQMQKVEPERLPYWQHEKLNEAAFTNFYAGVTEFLAGEYTQSLDYFYLALEMDPDCLHQYVIAWLAVVQEKLELPVTVKPNPLLVIEAKSMIQDFMVNSGAI